ncbi:thymidine phosphorylase [bacterium]|nr:thymidine phosphorylase [bacterium]
MRLFYDIIADKRDNIALSDEDISYFLESYLTGQLNDYQMSAMLMAVYFNSLNDRELKTWTSKMLYSGKVLDFSDIDGFVVDKHSTGGVGDKISIPLAPLLAELGFFVPMISGRGLGPTGGTLDKLESIPGFSVNIDVDKFHKLVREVGFSMIGQTAEIAPLDKRLYALRDVTATVESIPMIAASIMSKKLAEGIRGLMLDLKVGKGAFMKTFERGKKLAQTMQTIGNQFDTHVDVLFTNMDEPLGYAVGNSLEIMESLDVMQGRYVPQVSELTIEMAATLMKTFGMVKSLEEGREKAETALKSGKVYEKFRTLAELQGGDPRSLDDRSRLPMANKKVEIKAASDGFIAEVDALSFGKALIQLGGGRLRQEDSIDPGVGFIINKKVGEKVSRGETLYTICYSSAAKLETAKEYLEDAVVISGSEVLKKDLILGNL